MVALLFHYSCKKPKRDNIYDIYSTDYIRYHTPVNLSTYITRPTSLYLNWSFPLYCNGFILQYRQNGTVNWDSVVDNNSFNYSGSYQLKNLLPATKYECRVKGIMNAPTYFSEIKTFETNGIANVIFSKYAIIFDDNSNSIANPGERVGINIYLKNASNITARTVECYFDCSPSTYAHLMYISSSAAGIYNDPNSTSKNEDSLSAWQESAGLNISHADTFSFEVASSTPPGTVLTFYTKIWFYCDSFYNKLDSFHITVQ